MIANVGGHCFLGKIPMELLHLSSGGRAEMLLPVDLHSCLLKVCSNYKIMKLKYGDHILPGVSKTCKCVVHLFLFFFGIEFATLGTPFLYWVALIVMSSQS